ncbi:MAG: peptidase domain-containing ABC transporter [Lutimonas sp.]
MKSADTFRKARKLKTRQQDFTDCGAACLVSICRYYGLRVSISQVRTMAGTDQQGTSILGLLEASKKLGFDARGVKGDRQSLFKIPKPALAHVVLKNRRHHYVVIYKAKRKYIKIMDPANGRLKRMAWPDFLDIWNGILLILLPSETFETGVKTSKVWPWFWKLLQPHYRILLQAVVGSLLYTLLGFSTSVFIRNITDKVLVFGDLWLLKTMGTAMIVILFLQLSLSVFKDVFIIRIGQEIDARLVLGYQNHLFLLPQRFFDTMKIGEIISRVGDAIKIRMFISHTVMSLTVNVFIVILSYLLILYYNWKIGLFLLAMIPLYAGVFLLTDIFNRKTERRVMEASAQLESHLVESLQGIRTLKFFGAQSFVLQKTEVKFLSLLSAGYRSSLNQVFAQSSTFGIQNLFTTGLLWIGSFYVLESHLTTGELLSVYAILGYLMGPIAAVISSNKSIQNALIATDRLFEITELDTERPNEGVSLSEKGIGDIIFDRIEFNYKPGLKILNEFSATIRAGEITAIKGDSGSGKSTVLNLLQRAYPIEKGTIKIGGIDLRYISDLSLKKVISAVPQNIELFSGTIAENIALGDSCIDFKRVLEIIRLLEMDDFIENLEQGCNTLIGESGVNLSGGQRQRIAIARALYRRPQILLLDEPTSSLDAQSENSMIRAIESLKNEGKTVIIVSHRKSTLAKADRILVMQKGKLIQEPKAI